MVGSFKNAMLKKGFRRDEGYAIDSAILSVCMYACA